MNRVPFFMIFSGSQLHVIFDERLPRYVCELIALHVIELVHEDWTVDILKKWEWCRTFDENVYQGTWIECCVCWQPRHRVIRNLNYPGNWACRECLRHWTYRFPDHFGIKWNRREKINLYL